MKGVVFVELISMAESVAGEDIVDEVLETAPLESGGSFTSVGNYPCSELITLVQAFSERLNAPVDDLQVSFGDWMFKRFVVGYPAFFEGKTDAFTMLESIENEVHVEVRKLYPEVELPTFETERLDARTLVMRYRSERPLVAFCHGMIKACVDHFGTPADITRSEHHTDGVHSCDFNIRLAT